MPILCSIYDSFLQSTTQSRYPFDRFAFSYWKGNESIPRDPQSSFKASNPLLSKTFSSTSSIFFPPLSFHSPANSIDQSIRSFSIRSLHTLQNPDHLANTLLASLGPDPESQAALLSLIRFFPSLRPHFASLLSICCDLHAPVHAVIQLFEWWMFCELVWKEHAIRSFAISDALASPIAVQYETLWKLDALQISDSNDVLRCLVNSALMQAILLQNLTSRNERAVQSVFSILELNSEWSQSVYFETYMENVLKSGQKANEVKNRFDGFGTCDSRRAFPV